MIGLDLPPGLLAAFPAWPSMPPMPKWPPAWMAGGNQSGSPSICRSKLAKSGWSRTFWTSIGLASLCKIAGMGGQWGVPPISICVFARCNLTGHEVAAQARGSVRLADVDVEVGDCEGAFLHAATARTTPAVEHVCHRFGEVRREVKVVSVAAETFSVGEQDCVVDGCG